MDGGKLQGGGIELFAAGCRELQAGSLRSPMRPGRAQNDNAFSSHLKENRFSRTR
jgi:hypothetical protein